MRPVHKFSLAFGMFSLIAAVGCGGGGTVVLPNPTGNYSLASLNGSYVYQIRGTSVALGPYREIGVFTADKAGHITGGSDDFSAGGVFSNNITGTYTVANDGTGFLSINPTALGQITFAITLASSSKLYLMEADTFADGAGIAELQGSASAPSGTFVFRLHQIAASSGQNPVSGVGAMTITGGAVTGNLDQNLGGTSSQLSVTSGTFNSPNSLGRGLANFTDSTNFVTSLVYYVVSGSELALLVSNAGTIESGSAEAQTGAVGNGLSGSYAFGSRGDTGTLYDTVATAGQFTASGGAISAYVNDSMQLGNPSTANFTGSYTTQSNGRVAVSLNSGGLQEIFWMVNPARAFFLVNDPSKVEDGTADLQTVTTFAASTMKGQYAMVMDGIDLSPQILARIGTAQFDGASKVAVNELANASNSGAGAQSPGGLSGTYTIAANGRAVSVLNGSIGGLTVVTYAISASDAYALQVDTGTNTSGTIELQH